MKRYLMIGAPVTSVRTPPLLETFLHDQGETATVQTRHVEPAALDDFLTEVQADAGVNGLLVTMPHKRAIVSHLDAVTAVAARAGSVNAVKRLRTGAMVGAQFDGVALVNALRARGANLDTARILLAGVGGAGLAIAQAIIAHGCTDFAIAETSRERLRAALDDLGRDGPSSARAFDDAADATFDVLINATPLGMEPGDAPPFEPTLIERTPWIADIVADPLRTRLAALARESGATLVTGREMVQAQVPPIGRWLSSPDSEQ